MNTYPKYAAVVLELSINKAFDYGIPPELLPAIEKGMRVSVPLRGQQREGYVIAIKDTPDFPQVKPVTKLLSETALITEELFELALWMAKYYCAPLRQVFKTILPASLRKKTKHKEQLFVVRMKTREELKNYCIQIRNKHSTQADVLDVMLKITKGILLTELMEKAKCSRSPIDSLVRDGFLSVENVRIDRSPLKDEEYFQTKPKQLNKEQQAAYDSIINSLNSESYQTHLLRGVTGSGKTEVYLQAIDHALSQGKGSIMLVPEISLTTQMIERFRSRFKNHIAILHHRLSDGERFDGWHKINTGEARIVIGARSAVFCPVKNLGLIIVDEEHEHSYKQSEEAPCYNARDVAVMRGKLSKSTVILGSATPSIESFYNTTIGKYHYNVLHKRAEASSIPHVTIIDMKKEYEKAKGYTAFSEILLKGIKDRQAVGEQTILFLNRRGYNTTLICNECGEVVKCPHCDLALTFHKGDNILSCHLCGYILSPPPILCPSCHLPATMKFKGIGTEQVENMLHAILPDIRTLRVDADTTKHKGSHQRLLREFGTGKADVLIGTQMIAKGLHFPEVTLVGVLNSDSSLNIPDFRSSETVFQLITQVAGRSGRGVSQGEVIIQTRMPDNSTILHAAKQDFDGFFTDEIALREMFHYPPFTHLAKIVFSGKDHDRTQAIAEQFRSELSQHLPKDYELHIVLPAGHAKVKDQYRFQFLIKGKNMYVVSREIEQIKLKIPSGIKVFIDIDPTSTYF
jgi:primosomal protein N' (replication factor Y)